MYATMYVWDPALGSQPFPALRPPELIGEDWPVQVKEAMASIWGTPWEPPYFWAPNHLGEK